MPSVRGGGHNHRPVDFISKYVYHVCCDSVTQETVKILIKNVRSDLENYSLILPKQSVELVFLLGRLIVCQPGWHRLSAWTASFISLDGIVCQPGWHCLSAWMAAGFTSR